ncbi:MAG: hypothetical protein JSV52_01590 [Candidatus Zixiibacteriota bacterium]|nr:MAG: hypothetical protein JSV52_01590 [candidate division Zixibacteria bacterium]
MSRVGAFLLTLVFTLGLALTAQASDRIYGVITTVDGDQFEGLIRWDKNEGSWVDVLDGEKELPRKNLRKSSRQRYRDRSKTSIKIFGIDIGGGDKYWYDIGSAQSGIRFGHLRSMEIIDDDAVLLVTKSGLEFEMENGSTDIGDEIREIVIEDEEEGEIELVWDDIERIDFKDTPGRVESDFGKRLYGTLTTRRGEEYTGYVCWDIDELFEEDILDGNERRRKRKVPFGDIASIERYSSNGATVVLKSGEDLLLRETNDVNDGNRGIIISDLGFGQVRVSWDEFEKLEFKEVSRAVSFDDFDGGRRLYGTVTTEDGDTYTGEVRWDNDEEYSWEILDGEHQDVQFDVEFGLIKQIERKGYRACIVTVLDGREFRLRGSNDVDEDNKGVFVTLDDGEEVEVEWDDFELVTFEKR